MVLQHYENLLLEPLFLRVYRFLQVNILNFRYFTYAQFKWTCIVTKKAFLDQ